MKRLLTKTDGILIAVLLAVCGVLFAFRVPRRSESWTAEVLCRGELLYTFSSETEEAERTLSLPNGMILSVSGEGVAVLSSSCRDCLCVQCGRISRDGETAVCVPNETVVRITGKRTAPVDGLTY